jgi:hypothetical protein
MDAKNLLMLQQKAELEAAKRSGKTGTRMLDDSDNNIGNSVILQPQELPPGQLYTPLPQAITNNGRLLNLTASSRNGQSMTVVMTGAKVNNAQSAVGPMTGLIEFGNGSTFTRIEFDIPIGPSFGGFGLGSANTVSPQDSGAVIQVPASTLRVFGRYDNAYVTPEIYGFVFGGPGSATDYTTTPSHPRAPNYHNLVPNDNRPSPAPMNVRAFANYFGRIRNKLYRTHYIYNGDVGGAAAVTFTEVFQPCLYYIPPFAKTVQVIRQPQSAALVVHLYDQLPTISPASPAANFPSEDYDIATGALSPVIPITGNTNTIGIESKSGGNADKVDFVKLVYEIGF